MIRTENYADKSCLFGKFKYKTHIKLIYKHTFLRTTAGIKNTQLNWQFGDLCLKGLCKLRKPSWMSFLAQHASEIYIYLLQLSLHFEKMAAPMRFALCRSLNNFSSKSFHSISRVLSKPKIISVQSNNSLL